ncbi:sulfotransferase domain-containing protein [Telmatocola sphagniphila]|uniref:Sulfotransferase domain-containing protein n=1 Tax=Telmatocola sphagniphila TaxID=1123043 RepID=A0A8E6B692_9BACT|nr:sulfotransferase domain-containing protein [Telmatocola sphagniphila]QVL32865.1 sulfotransferase domain-containing protein [Telmatocola sphagniphila]
MDVLNPRDNAESAPKIRLAIISTPRSGNTWLSSLLSQFYGLPILARHAMNASDWASLPSELVFQYHTRRDSETVEFLQKEGFRVITLGRHPIDTLISILHFSWYEHDTEYWLMGRGGSEASIRASMPRSLSFLDYARGERARELLSVSSDWWDFPGVLAFKYEDMVADVRGCLETFQQEIGPSRCTSLEEVLERNTLAHFQKYSVTHHFWKGKPGLWRELLPEAETTILRPALRPFAEKIGYSLEPDATLDARTADANWVKFVGEELGSTITKFRRNHLQADQRSAELHKACESLAEQLQTYQKLNGLPIQFANAVKSFTERHPQVSGILRRIFKIPGRLIFGTIPSEPAK